jgi:hypothetical protein
MVDRDYTSMPEADFGGSVKWCDDSNCVKLMHMIEMKQQFFQWHFLALPKYNVPIDTKYRCGGAIRGLPKWIISPVSILSGEFRLSSRSSELSNPPSFLSFLPSTLRVLFRYQIVIPLGKHTSLRSSYNFPALHYTYSGEDRRT